MGKSSTNGGIFQQTMFDYWRGCQIWVAERELRKRPNSVEFSKIHLPSSEYVKSLSPHKMGWLVPAEIFGRPQETLGI
jgi:hypothetical protein